MKSKVGIAAALLAFAAVPAMAQGNAEAGRSSYQMCASCHGANGEGNKALNAPPLAGQSEAYIVRQLNLFRSGGRGSDTFGAQMKPMAMAVGGDDAVANVAAYLASLDAQTEAHDGGGDASAGQAAYGVCASCHGANAEGNDALGGPRLNILPDWYIIRQINNFKNGARGSAAGDQYGAQMKGMAMTVANDAAAANLAAYIATLGN